MSLLNQFEQELIPHDLSRSSIPAQIIGVGEISAIFQIGAEDKIIYKRIPIFPDLKTAKSYKQMYFEYCSLVKQAGINLPEDDAIILLDTHKHVIYKEGGSQFEEGFFISNNNGGFVFLFTHKPCCINNGIR